MANNLGFTPGVGAQIRTSQGVTSGAHMQVIKIGTGVEGDESYVPASVANGLTVDVTRVQNPVVCNNPVAANFKVDASGASVPVVNAPATTMVVSAGVAQPVSVRISNGAGNVDTLPVSIAAAVNVVGVVSVSNTPAVNQAGVWNIATVTSIANTVEIAGIVSITGGVAVAGTVTANQGTAAVIGNAWVVKITDGANAANLTNVAGLYALKVDVVKQTGGGTSQADRAAFTDGTTPANVDGGVYNDAITAPGAGQTAAVRITSYRAFHVNLRSNAGVEIATAAAPMRVDPTGATTQPVSGTVAGNQGTPAAQANAWPVLPAPTPSGFWKNAITFPASQTDISVRTPAGGKTAFVEGFIITAITSGVFKLYDQSSAAANVLYQGTPPAGACIVVTPTRPIPLSAVNNILRYSTGAGATGDVVVWGFDA